MASTFRHRVFLEDGTDLDDYVSNAGATWKEGDTLYAGGLPAYRITEVIPLADIDEYAAVWKVESV
jgi:hypothetical protein